VQVTAVVAPDVVGGRGAGLFVADWVLTRAAEVDVSPPTVGDEMAQDNKIPISIISVGRTMERVFLEFITFLLEI